MFAKLSAAAALLAAAAIVTGVATAGHRSTQERIEVTSQPGDSNVVVLTPLTRGPIAHDTGTATACCWTRRFIQRDGQSVEIDNPLRTFHGKNGTFTWRARIAWVDLSSSYSIGTGRWKIVRGTGAYAHLEGHGRIGIVTTPGPTGQDLANQAQGLVSLQR